MSLSLASCSAIRIPGLPSLSGGSLPDKEKTIEVKTTAVKPPKPIVPEIDQLNLKKVEWVIINQENAEKVLSELKDTKVLFAITADGYEKLALNLSDIRAFIEQQKKVIAVYEKQWQENK